MSSWDRMGERPIRLEEDEYGGRNGFRRYGEAYYSGNYDQNRGRYCGYGEQNRWSRNEEEDDMSLKDLFKEFSQVQNVKDEELELSLEMMNMKIDQYQVRIHEWETRLEMMNEWVENQPTGQFQNHIQLDPDLSNNQYDQGLRYQQNQWSRHEEEEMSLKEVFKEFIIAQNAIDEELELSMKVLNEKFDQNLRENQASLQEMERKLEMMNEWVESHPTGQITSNIQSNSRLSNNQNDQGLRYQTPSNNAKNANAKDSRSGLNHGNGEEQNGKEKKFFFADLEGVAGQLQKELRGNSKSVADSFFVQSIATQSDVPLRSNSPEQPGNNPKAHLEVGNHVGDEPMVYNEDETLKSTPILPTSAYEPRKETSLEMELEELLGTGLGCVVDTSCNNLGDITLDEFERMFDINEGPDLVNEISVEGKKELEPEMEIERESVIELDGEPCLPLKVDKNPISELKDKSIKLVELIFILTCLEKKEVLQVTNDVNDEPLDLDYLLHGKPSMKGVEKDKYGGKVGKYNRGDGAIMRETKEWHDAMAKTRMMLIVSTYGIPCDDVIFGYVGECDVMIEMCSCCKLCSCVAIPSGVASQQEFKGPYIAH